MNHCVIEAKVQKSPTIRYTQDNQLPIAEMEVSFDGLRAEDKKGILKVIGWGNIAQDLHNRIQEGQRVVLEGRLKMSTVPRQDGTKEKKAELTLSKVHVLSNGESDQANDSSALKTKSSPITTPGSSSGQIDEEEKTNWNTSPLIPDTDDIPF